MKRKTVGIVTSAQSFFDAAITENAAAKGAGGRTVAVCFAFRDASLGNKADAVSSNLDPAQWVVPKREPETDLDWASLFGHLPQAEDGKARAARQEYAGREDAADHAKTFARMAKRYRLLAFLGPSEQKAQGSLEACLTRQYSTSKKATDLANFAGTITEACAALDEEFGDPGGSDGDVPGRDTAWEGNRGAHREIGRRMAPVRAMRWRTRGSQCCTQGYTHSHHRSQTFFI